MQYKWSVVFRGVGKHCKASMVRPVLYKVKSTNEFATLADFVDYEEGHQYYTDKHTGQKRVIVNVWHSYDDEDKSKVSVPLSELIEIKTYGEIIAMFRAPETLPHLELKVENMGFIHGMMSVSIKNKAENARSSDDRRSDGVLFRIHEPLDPNTTPLHYADLIRFTEFRNDRIEFPKSSTNEDILRGKTLMEETRAEHELNQRFSYDDVSAPEYLLNPGKMGEECAKKAQKIFLATIGPALQVDLGFFRLCYDFDINKFGRVHSRRRHQIGHAYARGVMPQVMGINTQTVDDLIIDGHNLRSDAFLDLG